MEFYRISVLKHYYAVKIQLKNQQCLPLFSNSTDLIINNSPRHETMMPGFDLIKTSK